MELLLSELIELSELVELELRLESELVELELSELSELRLLVELDERLERLEVLDELRELRLLRELVELLLSDDADDTELLLSDEREEVEELDTCFFGARKYCRTAIVDYLSSPEPVFTSSDSPTTRVPFPGSGGTFASDSSACLSF